MSPEAMGVGGNDASEPGLKTHSLLERLTAGIEFYEE